MFLNFLFLVKCWQVFPIVSNLNWGLKIKALRMLKNGILKSFDRSIEKQQIIFQHFLKFRFNDFSKNYTQYFFESSNFKALCKY